MKIHPHWRGAWYSRYKYPHRTGLNAPVVWINSNTGEIANRPKGKITGRQFVRAHPYGSEVYKSKNPKLKEGKIGKVPFLKDMKFTPTPVYRNKIVNGKKVKVIVGYKNG